MIVLVEDDERMVRFTSALETSASLFGQRDVEPRSLRGDAEHLLVCALVALPRRSNANESVPKCCKSALCHG